MRDIFAQSELGPWPIFSCFFLLRGGGVEKKTTITKRFIFIQMQNYPTLGFFLAKFKENRPSGSFYKPSQNTGIFTIGIRQLSFFALPRRLRK